ncbi:RNA polymerase sigma factor [Solirubrobacter taibaiensis]|nr:RNA polymerase sigma factor [Solirubrobacter taibaiensis]
MFRIARQNPSASLLVRAQEDPRAYAAFYDAYSDRILAFLARRVFDPEVAVDLMSETFAKVLERRMQFRGESAAEEQGWLFAIARTELSHYWRSGRVERAALERFAVNVPELDGDEFERIEALAGLNSLDGPLLDAVAALPPDQRRAIELRIVEDLAYEEMAAVLAVSEQVARARVSRALRALARMLRDGVTAKDAAA